MASLKRRASILYNISRKIDKNVAKTLASGIFFGKMYHHLEIVGETSLKIRAQINNLIIKTAKNVLGYQAYGRTSEWMLKELKWLNFDQMHSISIQKSVYKFINPEDKENIHTFTDYMLTNRSVKYEAQNKIRPHKPEIGKHTQDQKTFLYKSVNLYNNLPRELTLMPNIKLFKKWLKMYYLRKEIVVPKREDNKIIINKQNINDENIIKCEET